MRDAFGGAFMLKVFLVFILIYICFTALALNYAKAFKVKNQIIEYIENSETVNFSNMTAQNMIDMQRFFSEEIHGKMNYISKVSCTGEEIYCKDGIKVEEIGQGINTTGNYYRVTTTFGWNIAFFEMIRKLNGNNQTNSSNPIGVWTITGETRLIVNE